MQAMMPAGREQDSGRGRPGFSGNVALDAEQEDQTVMHAGLDGFAHDLRKAEQAEGVLARARRLVADRVRAALQARADRRAGEMLMQLDEHLLRDIGVTRDQARRLAAGLADE